jgi:hypothetical protein
MRFGVARRGAAGSRSTPGSSASWTGWSSWACTTPMPGRARDVASERGCRAFERAADVWSGSRRGRRRGNHVGAPHEMAAAALDAGCHLLVEKPLTTTLAEADDLLARAEATLTPARRRPRRALQSGHPRCPAIARRSPVRHLSPPGPVPATRYRRVGRARSDDTRHRPRAGAGRQRLWSGSRRSGYR